MATRPSFQTDLRARCSTCSLRELCLPLGLDDKDLARLDTIVNRRRRIAAGTYLFRAGDTFQALSAVRSGFFKVFELGVDGQEQVSGFHMGGELMGLDAISTGRHQGNAWALEDSEVCEIPFDRLEELLGDMPRLQHQFHRLLSGTIAFDHGLMMMLGTMSAEHKLAAFLLNLSDRRAARGHPALTLRLSMSREEIGNYLGLKLETVSRMFSQFRRAGLIDVDGRNIAISDLAGLRALAGGSR